jgi:hypothetical protein
VDTMETDVSFLKGTSRQQYVRALHSGRRRGRRRGQGSRGRGHNSYAHQVLQRERELEQRLEDGKGVKVGSFYCNDSE